VKAGEASVENAKLQLEYCYIRSPIDGRLGELRVDPGNIVEENQTIMAIINQIKPIYVSFTVPEQNLLEIRKHMASTGKLKVEVTNPTEKSNPVSGELTFLNNEVDTTTGTIMLKALFSNEDELLWPGKFVNVALTLTTLYNAVVIPSQAVQTGQEGEYVFVVKPDLTVESRPVILGSRLEQDVVVQEGLDVQEKVVTNGQYDLSPGIKVEIKNSIESNSQNNSGTKKANEKHLKNL
jgi:multidrug efflux system membrane fusion protein